MSDAELTPSSPQLIWDMYLALVQECHHFNALESTYRTLASTWLLAAFAGIGYILTSVHAGTELLISGLSAAGAAGIVLLWVLDMLVYHRLLGAAFSEQLGFEERHSWLPQVAHEMVEMHGGDIVAKVVWFYI